MRAKVSAPARIALVAAQTTGGIGHHLFSLVSELTSRGARVEVLASAATREFGFEAAGAIFSEVEIPARPAPRQGLQAARRLLRRLGDADLVHAHGIRAGLVAGLAARRAGVGRVVVSVHNAVLTPRGWRRAAAAVADRALLRLADRLIYVSADLVPWAGRPASVLVIPVGADTAPPSSQAVRVAREALSLPGGTPLVVAVGRLHGQKGFDVLVEAAGLLQHDPPPAFALVGEGPMRAELEHAIARLGLGQRFHLLGHRADAPALLALADAVCVPSRWDAGPLVMHEAMALGRPIVACAVGGIPDHLGSEGGLLVPPDDPRALADALERVLGDKELAARLGAGALEAAASWPDAAATANRIADLYEELLGRPLGLVENTG